MGKITNYNPYVNGQPLAPDDHNKNVYDTAGGTGIMSEPNGGLEPANLDLSGNFRVYAEHIQPEEVVRPRGDQSLNKIDCFSDAFAGAPIGTYTSLMDVPDNLWKPVPGACERLHHPYTSTCGAYFVNFFANIWRVIQTNDGANTENKALMGVCLRVNNTIQSHTIRTMPETVFVPFSAASPALQLSHRAYKANLHFSLTHLAESFASGWHEVQLMLYMDQLVLEEADANGNLDWVPLKQAHALVRNATETVEVQLYHYQRLTFGIKSAGIVPFL